MNPAPPVTRRRIRGRLAAHLREARPQALAPVRKLRGARSLAPEHGVRGPRRGARELRRGDTPDRAVDARLLEDRLGEVRPRAVAVGRDVPEPLRKVVVDEPRERRPRGGRRTSESRAGRPPRRPRRAPRRAAASSAGSCAPSARTATTSARSTLSARRQPRRGASSVRTPTWGSARRTRRTASACDRRTRSRSRTSRAGAGAPLHVPSRRCSRRLRPAGRPRPRRRPSTQRCGGRGRAPLVTTCRRGGAVTSQSVARQRDHVVVREGLRERVAELATGARDQDATPASRADRIGVLELHRRRRADRPTEPCARRAPPGRTRP